MTTEQNDLCILQSIRSQDSNESDQPKPAKKPTQAQKSPMGNLLDDDHEYEIRDTIDFGDSIYDKNKPKPQPKRQQNYRDSGDFSAFNETDEIIMSAKSNEKGKITGYSGQKSNVPKQAEKVIESKKEIRYPQIVIPIEKSSPTRTENEKKFKVPERLNLGLTLDDEEQIDINVSMIGERPKVFKQRNLKKEELKPENVKMKKQIEPVQNPFQSIYLTNPKKVEERTEICLKVMDNTMYWVYENKQIKITSEALQALVEQFFKKQVMLPLISETQFKSEHVSVFMEVYTQFLNEFFPQQFKMIFPLIKSSTQASSKFQTGPSPLTPKSGQGLIKNLYENYLPNFLKGSGYSKAELIRNHMMKKLSLLNYLQTIQKQKPQQGREMVLEQKRKQTQYAIAVLELLVSFENSENYCRNNSKQGIDHTIWKEHGRKISELRKKWIGKIESIKNDFSFKI